MKALTIVPGKANSAQIDDVPEPPSTDGSILVRALALGICGTDFELISAEYGWAPPGTDKLILGHESLGRVEDAPADSGFKKNDLVVGIVRRPDPVPCIACAVNEWDMCRNGKYTERGIKERNGFASERWRIEPNFAIRLDPSLGHLGILMEPSSIVAKAWDHVTRIGERSEWKPKTALITGAGPIGLLAAMMGAQRGLEIHVLDRVQEGLKPQLVKELGGHYHTGPLNKMGLKPDIIVECTGVCDVIVEALEQLGSDGVLCLTGVSSKDENARLDVGSLNRNMVLQNQAVFGSVNANRRHWELAAKALSKANPDWLSHLITRKEPIDNFTEALKRRPDDIKVTLQFSAE